MPQYGLSGGINNIRHPSELEPNVQKSIVNILYDRTGKLAIAKNTAALDKSHEGDLFWYIFSQDDEVYKIYQWIPAYMPANAFTNDEYKDVFIVFYRGPIGYPDERGRVKVVYRIAANEYYAAPLQTEDIDVENVIADADTWQFIFVDGRAGHKAKRITIEQDGTILISKLGLDPIYKPAKVVSVSYSPSDNIGTGICEGAAFAYRYSFRNIYGESSPMSPLMIFDLIDFHRRGVFIDDDYYYDNTGHGSIESIGLEIEIPEGAAYLDIWRADADGVESEIPMTPMRLVRSINVKNFIGTYHVLDTHPYGATEVNLLKDDSPYADFVALSNTKTYFANAMNKINFPYDIKSIWKINIANNNPINYINRYIEFDLFDNFMHPSAQNSYIPDNIINLPTNKFRFMDDDMITPLECYWHPVNAISNKLSDGTTVNTHRIVKIRIPIMPAYSTKVIYLVITGYPVYQKTIKSIPMIVNFPDQWVS